MLSRCFALRDPSVVTANNARGFARTGTLKTKLLDPRFSFGLQPFVTQAILGHNLHG